MEISKRSWHFKMYKNNFGYPAIPLNFCQYFHSVMFLLIKRFFTARKWVFMLWWPVLLLVLYLFKIPSAYGEWQTVLDWDKRIMFWLFIVVALPIIYAFIYALIFAEAEEITVKTFFKWLIFFVTPLIVLPLLFLNNIILRFFYQDFLLMLGSLVLGLVLAGPLEELVEYIKEKSEELGEIKVYVKSKPEKLPEKIPEKLEQEKASRWSEFWELVWAYLKAKKEKICPLIEIVE